MEQIIVDNFGKLIIGQGGVTGLILLWCYLKIKQQCLSIQKLERGKVNTEICELKHIDLKEEMKEIKIDNKEAHTEINKKIEELKNIILKGKL